MVRICWTAATDETSLLSDRFEVLPVANAALDANILLSTALRRFLSRAARRGSESTSCVDSSSKQSVTTLASLASSGQGRSIQLASGCQTKATASLSKSILEAEPSAACVMNL